MHTKSQPYSTFYLHGGPGLSAIAERQRLDASLAIYWWDQPRPAHGRPRPFVDLVDAAEAEFTRRASEAGGKLALLANSFGSHITLRLARRVPQYISSITLLSPVHDMEDAFIRRARQLAKNSARSSVLLAAANALGAQPGNRNRFWELTEVILGTPGFADLYWSPQAVEQCQWFGASLGDPAMFDFNAFQATLNDFFDEPDVGGPADFTGPVSIVFGMHDALMDPEIEGKVWKKYFPQALVSVVDAGHFIHMELPADCWHSPRN